MEPAPGWADGWFSSGDSDAQPIQGGPWASVMSEMLGDADALWETVGVSQKELGTDPGPTGWSWIIVCLLRLV